MIRDSYSPLSSSPLKPGARLAQPAPSARRVKLDTRATEVMTDLDVVPAATIGPERPIDEANAAMVQRGVRLLFVINSEGQILGLLTATDLLGEKPLRFVTERGVKRSEVRVTDIMTPASQIEALSMQEVTHSQVGHIVASLKESGRQHALVAEPGGRRVRGIFSATQIARQLGVQLQTAEVARTFAEIEAALLH
jgi:CBS-domain-containing membrane protein